MSDERLEFRRVFGDEDMVEHGGATRPALGGIDLHQRLADARERRKVATDLHLVVLRADAGLLAGQHLRRRLRIEERLEPAFAQRIEGDDRHAATRGLLQRVQHPRAVAAHVLAEEEDAFRLGEVVERDRSHRDADARRQRDRRGLVAHVRAVRQVVVAVQPREQAVEVARLVRGAAGTVEHHVPPVLDRAQLGADRRDRLAPGDGHVFVARRVVRASDA